MNASNAKDYLPLVQALAEGKVIQGYFEIDQLWRDIVELRFDAPTSQYRIKPEPREVWVNEYPSGRLGDMHYESQDDAKRGTSGVNAKQVRYREVIE